MSVARRVEDLPVQNILKIGSSVDGMLIALVWCTVISFPSC
jgi:hypothetical protein